VSITPRPGLRAAPSVGVAIADPHELFRDELARAVRTHPNCELTGAADTVEELRLTLGDTPPDVLVVDSRLLPDPRQPRAPSFRTGWEPEPTLLLVAEEVDGAHVYAALEAGANGYLSKENSGEVLCRAIVDVARGVTILDPDAQTLMAGEVRLRTRDDRPLLSPRENEILRIIAAGRTAPQIARQLHLSTSTVKTHMLHIYEKLGVTERAAAVAAAMRWGLIE
jgi:two-component system, NarL family, nitrate/nitrite response regulator NarL